MWQARPGTVFRPLPRAEVPSSAFGTARNPDPYERMCSPTVKSKTRISLVWLLALSLLISVAASTVALSSRIKYYTAVADVNSMIPLIPDYVTLDELQAAASAKGQIIPARTANRARFAPVNVTYCAPTQETRFSVSDDNTVWDTNTQVEIFKSTYENGAHNITVASQNGDKVIAPGTEHSYSFMLKNEFDVPVDYTVSVKAYCTPDDVEIPVICRLSRYDGKWIAGDAYNWLSVPEFDGASDTAQMAKRSYVTYTLDWQWPFEGADERDTALGQLAMEEDLALTIEITTTAEADFGGGPGDPDPDPKPDPDPEPEPEPDPDPDPDPDQPPHTPDDPSQPEEPQPENPYVGEDLPPKTGDESYPLLWIATAAASFVLLMILILRKDEEETRT